MEELDDFDLILQEESEDWIERSLAYDCEPLDNFSDDNLLPLCVYENEQSDETDPDRETIVDNFGELADYFEELARQEVARKEFGAIYWLSKEIDVPTASLYDTLNLVRHDDRSAYRRVVIKKKSGSERLLDVPARSLKLIQRKINRNLLLWIDRDKHSFGFSGGSIVEAIQPHLGSASLLMVDIKNAFPTITENHVLNYLRQGKGGIAGCYGKLSWRASAILSDLMIREGRLPQGPPTSPRLFDAICYRLDRLLARLAKNVGGAYTRYADNIFFSVKNRHFPRPIRQAILKILEHRGGVIFKWHKLRICRLDRESVRLLGLNIIDHELHNTRQFKRRLRLAIRHVRWLYENDRDFEQAWQKLKGMYTFAIPATLPAGMAKTYEDLKKTIDSGSS